MEQIAVVTVVVDARSVADELAAAAVTGRLAACAQVGAALTSTYRWQGRIETAEEWPVQFKTADDRVEALVGYLRGAHPYDVPEILVSAVTSANPDYTAWVREQTRS
ncbi:divalent cation tolerance protein [Micromonospora pattaloongensis]|uniref:Divalent cation tolerance protein n=1 Tax=Micromonospora pattaloongensis TaxID=405436 RepID=A0A1H3FXP7_9ACTN|nr:divalent-cation tolerance protein CutA [Micromonospora pattaloongensis]SDX95615.1 divalent cation tolerance protein [Micromonospora pattaloongensis]